MSVQNQPPNPGEEWFEEWEVLREIFQEHLRRTEFPYEQLSSAQQSVLERSLFVQFQRIRLDLREFLNTHSERPSLPDFLDGLRVVETATLPEDERSCPVCSNEYDDSTPIAAGSSSEEGPEKEPALRLRCNHLVGKSCLRIWLGGGNKTCPFCRANVYATAPTN